MDDAAPLARTAAELPRHGPFRLGETLIDPATRQAAGPGGTAQVEPRVMQVLLALAEARGGVVTREALIQLCWNGQVVGDDAINRAIGEVRRLARIVGADSFSIETISRTGYRLVGAVMTYGAPPEPVSGDAARRAGPNRRWLFAAGGAGLAAAGAGAWALWPDPARRRAADLAAEAAIASDNDQPADAARAIDLLRQAVRLQPRNAALWGRLALACEAGRDFVEPGAAAELLQECQVAAARALALDPKQPDARVALIQLRPAYGDWLDVEGKLRAVLADAPEHLEALSGLAVVLQSVGRTVEMSGILDRIAARRPLAPNYQFRRTYALWARGRLGEADRNADRAIELWPRHPGVWLSRIWLMGFTGRPAVALSQIDDAGGRPEFMSPTAAATLRLSMQAIQSRQAQAVEAAVAANLKAAMTGGHAGSVNAIMILSALGRIDEALAVADGYLLRQGRHIMPLRPGAGQPLLKDQQHRKTLMLFIPVCAPLRADPRFLDICRGCGLADYWRQSGHGPDFFGGRPA